MTQKMNKALWLLMKFDINRYLMSITTGRQDGAERAVRHLNLSRIIYEVFADENNYQEGDDYDHIMFIHDFTQQFTSKLEVYIGFPINDRHPDYDLLAVKFFKGFLACSKDALACAKKQAKEPGFKKYSFTRYLNNV